VLVTNLPVAWGPKRPKLSSCISQFPSSAACRGRKKNSIFKAEPPPRCRWLQERRRAAPAGPRASPPLIPAPSHYVFQRYEGGRRCGKKGGRKEGEEKGGEETSCSPKPGGKGGKKQAPLSNPAPRRHLLAGRKKKKERGKRDKNRPAPPGSRPGGKKKGHGHCQSAVLFAVVGARPASTGKKKGGGGGGERGRGKSGLLPESQPALFRGGVFGSQITGGKKGEGKTAEHPDGSLPPRGPHKKKKKRGKKREEE